MSTKTKTKTEVETDAGDTFTDTTTEQALADLTAGNAPSSLIASALAHESDVLKTERTATLLAWRATGEILAAHMLDTVEDVKSRDDLHTVKQAVCHDAMIALCKLAGAKYSADKGDAKLRIRAALYVTPDVLTEALGKLGSAAGPKSGRGAAMLAWCQYRDTSGRKHLGSNATKRQANAAKRKRETDAASAASKRFNSITRMSRDSNVAGTIVSAGLIKDGTREQLSATIDALREYIAGMDAADAAKNGGDDA